MQSNSPAKRMYTLIGILLGILFYYIIENNNDNDLTPA